MRSRYLIGLAVVCLAIFLIPARPQTQGATLSLGAHWDDGSAVAGQVTIASVHVVGADTVLATEALTEGRASVTLALASNSIYDVTVFPTSGEPLLKFPFTTALVNPQNIQRGTMNLVLRKADRSLKSANVSVSMDF